MGIRVDAESLKTQLEMSDLMHYMEFPYHQAILNDEIPLSIGGGIGQSRTYMLLLNKAHLGEVSVTVWPQQLKDICAKKNIVVLEKAVSLGRGGILASDVRWSFPRSEQTKRYISSFVAGLGGRNVSTDDLRYMVEKAKREPVELEFLGLRKEIIAEKDL